MERLRKDTKVVTNLSAPAPCIHVRALTGEGNVEVSVCGAHASWRDNTPEDFPDYVDVALAAPTKVNDYRALGYIVILF